MIRRDFFKTAVAACLALLGVKVTKGSRFAWPRNGSSRSGKTLPPLYVRTVLGNKGLLYGQNRTAVAITADDELWYEDGRVVITSKDDS